MEELKTTLLDNTKAGKKSFIFAYYGGAGGYIGAPGQIIVLNDSCKSVGYPLEERLEILARLNGLSCVFMIFDCSRVPLSKGLDCGANVRAE